MECWNILSHLIHCWNISLTSWMLEYSLLYTVGIFSVTSRMLEYSLSLSYTVGIFSFTSYSMGHYLNVLIYHTMLEYTFSYKTILECSLISKLISFDLRGNKDLSCQRMLKYPLLYGTMFKCSFISYNIKIYFIISGNIELFSHIIQY